MHSIKTMLKTVQELFSLLWAKQLGWLIPMVLFLFLFGFILVLGSSTPAGPFIYTLF